jgi:hypothetical protein
MTIVDLTTPPSKSQRLVNPIPRPVKIPENVVSRAASPSPKAKAAVSVGGILAPTGLTDAEVQDMMVTIKRKAYQLELTSVMLTSPRSSVVSGSVYPPSFNPCREVPTDLRRYQTFKGIRSAQRQTSYSPLHPHSTWLHPPPHFTRICRGQRRRRISSSRPHSRQWQ